MIRKLLFIFILTSVIISAQSLEILVGASMPSSTLEEDIDNWPGSAYTGYMGGLEFFIPLEGNRVAAMFSAKYIMNMGDRGESYSISTGYNNDSWVFRTLTAGLRTNVYNLEMYEFYILFSAGLLNASPPDAEYNFRNNSHSVTYNSVDNLNLTAEAGFEVLIEGDTRLGVRYLYLGSYDMEVKTNQGSIFIPVFEQEKNSVSMFAILLTATWEVEI